MTNKQIKDNLNYIMPFGKYKGRQIMTEEIIIDGVDVAKCRYFTSKWDFNNCGHICKETECKYKRLWYKKQLKCKEQECEE